MSIVTNSFFPIKIIVINMMQSTFRWRRWWKLLICCYTVQCDLCLIVWFVTTGDTNQESGVLGKVMMEAWPGHKTMASVTSSASDNRMSWHRGSVTITTRTLGWEHKSQIWHTKEPIINSPQYTLESNRQCNRHLTLRSSCQYFILLKQYNNELTIIIDSDWPSLPLSPTTPITPRPKALPCQH